MEHGIAGHQTEEGARSRTGIADLVSHSRRLAADFAHLAVLDARHSVGHVIRILCGAVIASVLVVSAWLAFVAAATGWVLESGTSWPAALMVAAGLNLVAALVIGIWLRRRQKMSLFEATLRQLRGDPPGSEP